MKIGLAQIDPVIGAFEHNCNKICSFAEAAAKRKCDLAVFPEMALVGYPPRDLLEKDGFVRSSQKHWERIARASRSIPILCGVVAPNESGEGKPFYNSALFCSNGRIERAFHKRLLPSYDVFDEERYFEPGIEPGWMDFLGLRLGITICEDIWTFEPFLPRQLYRCNPVQDLAAFSPDLIINMSASPFHAGKSEQVRNLLSRHAGENKTPLVYVNQVGGNDELIFHGCSMVLDASGAVKVRADDFAEDLAVWDTGTQETEPRSWAAGEEEEILEALRLGLRDYVLKCGFSRVLLGLSGGIDSALTACIAAESLGAENVRTVAMPGPYNDPASLDLSRDLAGNLGAGFDVVPIDGLFDLTNKVLAPVFAGREPDITEENIQARLRGLILMSISNKFNELLLNTGNKSELSVGYCTLYGDMTGGLSVLGDVPKGMVYRLARLINERHGWIPEGIISRPPSAELSPGQKDEDTLPPYRVLDGILHSYVENNQSPQSIVQSGYDSRTVQWVLRRVNTNEYKRRQAPPVLRVTTKAFGIGRRLPIAHGYREEES